LVYQYLDVPRDSEEINAVIFLELLSCSPFSSVLYTERCRHTLDLNAVKTLSNQPNDCI